MATISPNTAPRVLKKLFDEQLERLEATRFHTRLRDEEFTPLFPLLEKVGETKMSKGSIPFVIVPLGSNIDPIWLSERMREVKDEGGEGKSKLGEKFITDRLCDYGIPSAHYLLVDVRLETKMQRIPQDVWWWEIKKASRTAATITEGVSVAMYKPEIFTFTRGCSIDLPGSRYKKHHIPYLYGTGNGGLCPGLDSRPDDEYETFHQTLCRPLSSKKRLALPEWAENRSGLISRRCWD